MASASATQCTSQTSSDGKERHEDVYNYPGKARSIVWKYFGFTKKQYGPPIKSNLNMDKGVCKICKKAYANKEAQAEWKLPTSPTLVTDNAANERKAAELPWTVKIWVLRSPY
ncbi:hypothetical protein ACF0H5_003306 [Mactra antiquata]